MQGLSARRMVHDVVASARLEEIRPRLHERPPLFERVDRLAVQFRNSGSSKFIPSVALGGARIRPMVGHAAAEKHPVRHAAHAPRKDE
jgi:hypothetical protein